MTLILEVDGVEHRVEVSEDTLKRLITKFNLEGEELTQFLISVFDKYDELNESNILSSLAILPD